VTEHTRALLAEACGTFWFFLIGAGAIVTNQVTNGLVGLVGVALAHGLALSVAISSFGAISGGHFNPAVTFGLAIAKKHPWPRVPTYWGAQLAGALLAGIMLRLIFDYAPAAMQETNLGTPGVAQGVSLLTAIIIEALLTLFLMWAVFGTAVSPNAPKIAGFGIGLAVTADILIGGPLTGASMNPARWPAVTCAMARSTSSARCSARPSRASPTSTSSATPPSARRSRSCHRCVPSRRRAIGRSASKRRGWMPVEGHGAYRRGVDPLDRANEIAVVLGGGISAHGDADPATIARTQAAALLARERPLLAFILTGRQSGRSGAAYPVSEAKWMAEKLAADGVKRERMVLEDESRDTLGNAVLVAARYLRELDPRPLWIVTSAYHMPRSVLAFAATLGARWPIRTRTSPPALDDAFRSAAEAKFIQETSEFFDGIDIGDLDAIIERLCDRYPAYATLDRLKRPNPPSGG
jgi:MIP family channel proteins